MLFRSNNRFTYKNFDLNILIQGNQGGKVFFPLARHISTGSAWGQNQLAFWTRQWRPVNELPLAAYTENGKIDMSWDGKTPFGYGENFPSFNDYMFLSDATFIRIKNIALGYNLPVALCKRIGLGSARLYVSGDNLFTFTNYVGVNPETNSDGNGTTSAGADYSSYSLSRKYSIGIKITF